MGILVLNQDYQFRIRCLTSIVYICLFTFRKIFTTLILVKIMFLYFFLPLAFFFLRLPVLILFLLKPLIHFWVWVGVFCFGFHVYPTCLADITIFCCYFLKLSYCLLLIYMSLAQLLSGFFPLAVTNLAIFYYGIIAWRYALKSFKQF